MRFAFSAEEDSSSHLLSAMCGPMDDLDELNPVFIKISLEDIVYLKAILEGYEELGVIRTLNRLGGEIVILSPKSMATELHLLLEALKEEVSFRIIPPPKDICEDWLLSEYFEEEPSRDS